MAEGTSVNATNVTSVMEQVSLRVRRVLLHPARIVPVVYAVGWVLGTILLRLPVSAGPDAHPGWGAAAFTSMSALCITGLAVVDTAQAWSHTGQMVILALVQVGGFGIMALTSLVLFSLRGGSSRVAAQVALTEVRGDHRGIAFIPRRILTLSLVTEMVLAIVLTGRFLLIGLPGSSAVYQGLFHAVSAFNNAGFSLFTDGLVGFNDDMWVMVPICLGIIVGGVGFPVYLEILDRRRRGPAGRQWSMHLRLTLGGTAVLLVIGFLTFAAFEWTNDATLGSSTWSGRVLGALGGAVFPRTAGFNSIDYAQASAPTILVNDLLMMVGGGSGSTAGGIKITTAAILIVAVGSELAGERDVVVARRRVSFAAIRRALAVVVISTIAVLTAVIVMSVFEHVASDRLAFEAVSAFSNTGLSMGLTPHLSTASDVVLMVLMFLGRVGPVSAVAALTLRDRQRRYRRPQEDPLIG